MQDDPQSAVSIVWRCSFSPALTEVLLLVDLNNRGETREGRSFPTNLICVPFFVFRFFVWSWSALVNQTVPAVLGINFSTAEEQLGVARVGRIDEPALQGQCSASAAPLIRALSLRIIGEHNMPVDVEQRLRYALLCYGLVDWLITTGVVDVPVPGK